MIGLVYKDFMVLKKQLSYYVFFFVIYGALAIFGVFPVSILSALVAVIAMTVPMSSMAYDDLARWDKYAAATPVGRGGLVGGKYLFTLAVLLLCGALVAVAMTAFSLAGLMNTPLAESLAAVLACVGVALIMDAVILPLLFKFGTEKCRVISLLFFVAIFGGSMLLGRFAQRNGGLSAPPPWLLTALPVLFGLVSVGAFVISYFISRGIYEKKEL